jgi:hypothetical protein
MCSLASFTLVFEAAAQEQFLQRLTVHDAPVTAEAPETSSSTAPQDAFRSYLTSDQWIEVQQLMEEMASHEDAEPITIERACQLLGISLAYSPYEMFPMAPPNGRGGRTVPCPPGTLFSQTAYEPTDPWTAGTSDEAIDLQRFDSYSVPADVCSIRWWGINAVNPGTGFVACDRTGGGAFPDRYNIRFYPDAAGQPDLNNPAFQYLGVAVDGVTLLKAGTGLFYNTTFELFQYDLDLSALGCSSLLSGWVSIQGVDDGQNCWFLQMASPDGDASSCLLDTLGGPPAVCGPPDNDYDLSMCLGGSVDPGACCNQDTGVCTDTPAVDFFACMAMGPNMRFIPNGLCTDFNPPCGVAFGACCFSDGSCQEMTNLDCATAGGNFAGEGTNCTPNVCPQPCTCTPINAFPHYENFEAEATCGTGCAAACPLIGDWQNATDDDIDWAVDVGGTPSSGTGPAFDFDPGTAAGKYLYTESSVPCENSTAILLSPCYDVSGLISPSFSFAYHMAGATTGSIEVQVSADDCITWTTEFSVSGAQQSGSTDPWATGSASLSAYAGASALHIRIVGTVGPSFTSDMAIDGLRLFESAGTTGACCNDDGTCIDNLSEGDCQALGGNWQGAFTTCDAVACGGGGACCLPDGSCIQANVSDCIAMGGSHQGDQSCNATSCPQPCTCGAPIGAFPYNEDFEAEPTCSTTCGNACVLVGDWYNVDDGSDDFDWTIDEGGTTSTTTGPSQDANPGTPTGNYAYTEGSGTACQNGTAHLRSPCFDISSLGSPLFVFAYHMFGANIVSLNVDVSTDNCANWTTELTLAGPQHASSADPWTYTSVDLSGYAGSTNLRIRLRAETGASFNADMAVDDLSMVDGAAVTGACCTGATCTDDVSEADCLAGGGTYLGDFSTCGAGNPCVGACCLSDGSCSEQTEADCAAAGGTYAGGGTSCLDVICNDTCPGALDILALPFFTVFDNSNANADGPPGNGCNTASATVMQNDVWFRFTPTEDCLAFLDVDPDFGSGYDGIMQLYTGPDCNNLSPLGGVGEGGSGCFDDPEPYSAIFNATAGTTYWFQVGDWGTGAGGGLTSFNLTCRAGNFGACCLPNGGCMEVADEAECIANGGVYQGDLVPCSQAACPQPCACTAAIGTFPYNEDWEAEATCSTTCGNACVLSGDWTNLDDGTDDFDWTIDEGGTSSTTTGPSQDANPGTPTGNYAYTEGSGTTCQNATAILLSPCFDISGLSEPLVLFAYHMFGVNIVALHVEVSTDDCLSWNTELTLAGPQHGASTDPWSYEVVDLAAYAGTTNLRVRFRGETGASFNADMAIDDISLFNGPITGACCEADGTCSDNVTDADCTAGGGRWQGPLTQCANVPTCGGACCTSSGCSIQFEEDCDALGGVYLGDDTVCSGLDCNNNGFDDECDIASGTSTDCNGNGIPDDCEILDDCDGDGTPDICDPDCNENGVSDACDIFFGDSLDCQPDGVPDECQLGGGGSAAMAITEVDMGGTDKLEIQNVSGGVLDTSGWMVAVSDSPYSDLNTVNPIIQMLPATMAPDEIMYWTDSTSDNPWGNNLFWNPGNYPTFSGWAMILDDTGAIVDFAIWNVAPEAVIAGLSLNIGPYTIAIGDQWIGDGFADAGACGTGFSMQRQGDSDNNDAADFICQAANIGSQNPGLMVPLSGIGGGADCNGNGIPDACDIADCPPGDISCGDCNGNGVPDGCELSGNDCNLNGIDDDCDIDNGTSQDCNGNRVPDECDILDGTSEDCNNNGIPDECDIASGEELVFSQAVIPGDSGVGPGLLLAIGSSCPFGNSSAEDFTLASSTNITRITWEGVYFGAASDFPGADANFHVTFYEDNGAGNIGAIVADFPSVAVAKAPAPRPGIFGTNPVYTYDSVLPATVPVNGGQRYWISINGDPAGAGGPVFGWMVSDEGNATLIGGNDQPLQTTAITCASLPALAYNVGGDLGDQDADLALTMYGEGSGSSADCNGNGVPDECDIADGFSTDCDDDGTPDECADPNTLITCGGLDIKPGSCPNPFNRNSNGVLPVGLLGTDTFDVSMVDISTLRLERADGIGGAVAPNEGPPGPHTVTDDVGTPFSGVTCDCHELTGDGTLDLNMHFRTQDVVDELELDLLPNGAQVELIVTGNLIGGASFESPSDCIWLVPPGTPPGLVQVTSNVNGAWVDVTPTDVAEDAGGFFPFVRTYSNGELVELKAPLRADELVFRRWTLDGVDQPAGQRVLAISLQSMSVCEAHAVYVRLGQPIQRTSADVFDQQPVIDPNGG